jgi:hypothetical protein
MFLTFVIDAELIWIGIMASFAHVRAGNVDTVLAWVTVMSSISAFISVNAHVAVSGDNALCESVGVVGTWIVVTDTNVIGIG